MRKTIHLPVALLSFLLLSLQPSVSQTLKEPIKYLALGDSYTIGESVKEEERWPVRLINELKELGYETEPVTIIARTGWRTDNLMQAIEDQSPAKDHNLVSLLIGVNDQYQGRDTGWYRPRFEELLNKAIELAGGNRDAVFVVSIPDYAYTPFGQAGGNPERITTELNQFNAINKSITESYGIAYYDITPVSREGLSKPEYVASDRLHPSGIMYAEWVKIILEGLGIDSAPLSNRPAESEAVVHVSPNPAGDSIDFHFNGIPGNIILKIFDTRGSLVGSLSSEGQASLRFDLTGIKPGVYFYQVDSSGGKTSRGKFIKS